MAHPDTLVDIIVMLFILYLLKKFVTVTTQGKSWFQMS